MVIFWINPIGVTVLFTNASAELVEGRKHRDAEDYRDDGMPYKGDGVAGGVNPREDEKWIDKGRKIEHDRIKDDHSHALQRVCINNVGADGRVSHLNASADYQIEELAQIHANQKIHRRNLHNTKQTWPTIQCQPLSMLTPQTIMPTAVKIAAG
jgi:hypothetical protein